MDNTRQMHTRLEDFRKDHLERYRFAQGMVSGDVLDAACGVGYGSKMLTNVAHKVTGIDIEFDALEHAEAYFPGPTYIQGNLEVIDLPYVDWAVSFETIEHLKHPEAFLRRLRGVAKNLICSVPNEDLYKFDPMKFMGDKYPHVRHYTPEEFDDLLYSTGWTVESRHCQVSKISGVTNGTDGMFLVYVCK